MNNVFLSGILSNIRPYQSQKGTLIVRATLTHTIPARTLNDGSVIEQRQVNIPAVGFGEVAKRMNAYNTESGKNIIIFAAGNLNAASYTDQITGEMKTWLEMEIRHIS